MDGDQIVVCTWMDLEVIDKTYLPRVSHHHYRDFTVHNEYNSCVVMIMTIQNEQLGKYLNIDIYT